MNRLVSIKLHTFFAEKLQRFHVAVHLFGNRLSDNIRMWREQQKKGMQRAAKCH